MIMKMATMKMNLVILEGALKVAPVTPSEDHIRRPAEYLDCDYHGDHAYGHDYHDYHDDVDNHLEDLPWKSEGKSSAKQGVRFIEAQLPN